MRSIANACNKSYNLGSDFPVNISTHFTATPFYASNKLWEQSLAIRLSCQRIFWVCNYDRPFEQNAYIINCIILQEWLSPFPPHSSVIVLLRNGRRRGGREVLRLVWFMFFLITSCRRRLFFSAVRMHINDNFVAEQPPCASSSRCT